MAHTTTGSLDPAQLALYLNFLKPSEGGVSGSGGTSTTSGQGGVDLTGDGGSLTLTPSTGGGSGGLISIPRSPQGGGGDAGGAGSDLQHGGSPNDAGGQLPAHDALLARLDKAAAPCIGVELGGLPNTHEVPGLLRLIRQYVESTPLLVCSVLVHSALGLLCSSLLRSWSALFCFSLLQSVPH